MHVFQAFEHLVNDILLVDVFQYICSDNCVKISIHEIKHKVNIPIVFSSDYILEANDIFMS